MLPEVGQFVADTAYPRLRELDRHLGGGQATPEWTTQNWCKNAHSAPGRFLRRSVSQWKRTYFFPGVNTQNTIAATNALIRKTFLSLQLSNVFFWWEGGGGRLEAYWLLLVINRLRVRPLRPLGYQNEQHTLACVEIVTSEERRHAEERGPSFPQVTIFHARSCMSLALLFPGKLRNSS